MSRSGPPRITGLELKRPIGSGGFADVYLYEETVLRREVAVKVLATAPTASEKASFDAEANVMAQLSSHPAIVPIYRVGTALDGRPYLTMEYCGGDPLSTRYRRSPLPVPEVLELGIKVGAAVETAHRAGILHRDIKPANILTTAFGTPKLTDFGISHLLAAEGESVVGFSVPWSPPEVFGDDAPVDRRTDVYSLAATLHTLLAGRTPFEVTGKANDAAVMMSRIETARVPRLTRPDVPESLNRVLALGMAKQVTGRPASAMALARALQEVQIEMRLPTTRIDVLDASTGPAEDGAGDDERTSVRPITVIVPDDGTVVPPPRPGLVSMPRFSVEGTVGGTVGGRRPHPTPDVLEGTAVPARRTPTDDEVPLAGQEQPDLEAASAEDAPRARSGLLVGALVGGLVAVVATAGVLSLLGGDDGDGTATPRLDSGAVAPPVNDPVTVAAPRTPTRVTGVLDGPRTAVFTWRPRDPEDGDTYRWSLAGDGGETYYTLVDAPRAQVDVPAGRRACIVVTAVRGGQQSDPSPLACAESR